MGIYRILNDDELMHYGVKGMRWGNRKAGYTSNWIRRADGSSYRVHHGKLLKYKEERRPYEADKHGNKIYTNKQTGDVTIKKKGGRTLTISRGKTMAQWRKEQNDKSFKKINKSLKKKRRKAKAQKAISNIFRRG